MSSAARPSLAAACGVDPGRPAAVVAALLRAGVTVAAAESLTGGLLTALLTEVPGSSAVLRGGLVVYATDLKTELAGVDPTLLAERGPVDADVARQLADGARARCAADVGLGLTGVAGPDRQHDVAVGTFFVALSADSGQRMVAERGRADHPPGRADVRAAAVRAALDLLAEHAEQAVSATGRLR